MPPAQLQLAWTVAHTCVFGLSRFLMRALPPRASRQLVSCTTAASIPAVSDEGDQKHIVARVARERRARRCARSRRHHATQQFDKSMLTNPHQTNLRGRLALQGGTLNVVGPSLLEQCIAGTCGAYAFKYLRIA